MESDEGQTPLSVDWSAPASSVPDVAPQIEFAPAGKANGADVRRMRFGVLYFGVFGIWAVGLALTGEPVYGVLAALVLFEVAVTSLRASSLTGSVVYDQVVAERLTPVLIDLCARAGCAPPRVVLRSELLRVAAVRRRKGKVDLFLSRPFVELVDDPQLRSIIAHEVIHIVHNDFRFVRARAMVGLLVGVALGIVAWLAVGYEFKNLPIFVAVLTFATILIQLVLSPLNRRCEIRADVEGAALSGDARVAAQALTIAHAESTATRKRLLGRPPWRWLLYPLSGRMPTHPPIADRVARLDGLP